MFYDAFNADMKKERKFSVMLNDGYIDWTTNQNEYKIFLRMVVTIQVVHDQTSPRLYKDIDTNARTQRWASNFIKFQV